MQCGSHSVRLMIINHSDRQPCLLRTHRLVQIPVISIWMDGCPDPEEFSVLRIAMGFYYCLRTSTGRSNREFRKIARRTAPAAHNILDWTDPHDRALWSQIAPVYLSSFKIKPERAGQTFLGFWCLCCRSFAAPLLHLMVGVEENLLARTVAGVITKQTMF